MQDSGVSSGSAEIIDTLKNDPSVETDRLAEATVVDEVEEHVDFVSEVTLTVTERAERATFPRSEYSQLCRQRVPYGECYDHAPGDFSEATVEFVEVGRQPEGCGDCGGSGKTVCSSCGGRGTTRCIECGGTGTRDCSDCSGTGMGWDDDGPCMTCSGSGDVPCDAFDCDGGQAECRACGGGGETQCSLCSGEGAVVTAVHGALEFARTRTTETVATAFETDMFELDESDGTLVDRSREEPDDRVGEGAGDTSRVWRRVTEQRSVPCVSVTYECDGETYTAGWVDGDVRRGRYPPSETAVREQIGDAVDGGYFAYDSAPDDGVMGLVVADIVTTGKTLLWIFGGLLAVSAGFGLAGWVFGSVLQVGSIGSAATGALSLVAVLGTALYLTARLHGRAAESTPGRSMAAIASPALVSLVAVALLAAGQVPLLAGGSLFGFAAALWGVSVARHLRSVADEASFLTHQRRTFLDETLASPPRVVDRHDLSELIPDPQTETERRADRAAAVAGIGCVGLAGVHAVGALLLSLAISESASGSTPPVVVIGVLALPAALILVSLGALATVRR